MGLWDWDLLGGEGGGGGENDGVDYFFPWSCAEWGYGMAFLRFVWEGVDLSMMSYFTIMRESGLRPGMKTDYKYQG